MELFHPYKLPYKWVPGFTTLLIVVKLWRHLQLVTGASWESRAMRIILLLLRLSMANWGQLWATIGSRCPRAATAVKRMKFWDSGDSMAYEKVPIEYVTSGKLTWQWKITQFDVENTSTQIVHLPASYVRKNRSFQCHISSPTLTVNSMAIIGHFF